MSFEGEYYTLVNAEIYDRPVYVAAGGPVVAKYAGRAGDGFICTSGKGMELYNDKLMPAIAEGAAAAERDVAGIDKMIEIKMSYDRDHAKPLENTRFWAPLSLTPEQKHSVSSAEEMERLADELPIEQIAKRWIVASDPDEAVAQIKPYLDAGLNHLVFHGPGHDQERFLTQFAEDNLPRLRNWPTRRTTRPPAKTRDQSRKQCLDMAWQASPSSPAGRASVCTTALPLAGGMYSLVIWNRQSPNGAGGRASVSNEVPAVGAAVRILERMAAELPKAVSPTVLVNELELNRSTCYNILATLQRAGWVSKLDGRGGWTLGPRLLSLTGVSDDSIVAVVQDEIDVLSRRLGYVVFAAKQDDSGGYTVIAVSDPRRGVRVIVDVGDRFPFSAPALMQAMYAYRPFDDFAAASRGRAVEKFTEYTVADRESLAEVFAAVRQRGFSTSIRQFNLAQSAAAAPVFDNMGKPSLAIGTLAFSSELDYANIDPIGKLINSTAARITERTGGTVPIDASAPRASAS